MVVYKKALRRLPYGLPEVTKKELESIVKALKENMAHKKARFMKAASSFSKIGKVKFSRSDSLEWIDYLLEQYIEGKSTVAKKQAKATQKALSSFQLLNTI